jgi:hypothetical protein
MLSICLRQESQAGMSSNGNYVFFNVRLIQIKLLKLIFEPIECKKYASKGFFWSIKSHCA